MGGANFLLFSLNNGLNDTFSRGSNHTTRMVVHVVHMLYILVVHVIKLSLGTFVLHACTCT
jgi:hypothetical protein